MRRAVSKGIAAECETSFLGVSDINAFEEEEAEESREFGDEMSGKRLDHKLVGEARSEEIKELQKHGVYVKVKESECWENTGKAPMGTRLCC